MKRKFGQSERARYREAKALDRETKALDREAKASAKVEEVSSLLAEAAEAHQASAHTAFLNAAVSNRFVKLYTSSATSSHVLPLLAWVSIKKSVTLTRTHPSGTETQGVTNAFVKEREQELTFTRHRSPSTVISLGDGEEEELI